MLDHATIKTRIQQLQSQCTQAQLDGYFIPASDAHQNEYVPPCWQRRTWLSGFTGSNGDVLILQDGAYLWTDSRYTLQAQDQCADTGIHVLHQQQAMIQEVCTWFMTHAKPYRIGVDAQVITWSDAQKFSHTLESMQGKLVAENQHRVDSLWEDQPAIPSEPCSIWDPTEDAETAQHKIGRLRAALEDNAIDAFACNKLDAIAWLMNCRGQDIAYNPLIISYALITLDDAIWFVDPEKCNTALKHYCTEQGITLKPYNDFAQALANYQGILGLDPNEASWWMANQASQAKLVPLTNPITLMKACKNQAELNSIRLAHKADALALITFFEWLENHWQTGVDEYQAAVHLQTLREHAPDNCGLSFETISAFESNGAIVHYTAAHDHAKIIDDTSLYLLDSGGQYTGGTTDVTRVIHLGKPTTQQKEDYTRVLQGHIDLAKAIFPKGTTGTALDAFARQYLWQVGLNFGHGTGHGVGCNLCVHEGPASISPRGTVPLALGMVLSNEPGIYRTGHYGIRIENVQAVVPYRSTDFGTFYQFETMTCVPYAKNLIDKHRLTADQLTWLNDYHQYVFDTLSPLCDKPLKKWLKTATKAL